MSAFADVDLAAAARELDAVATLLAGAVDEAVSDYQTLYEQLAGGGDATVLLAGARAHAQTLARACRHMSRYLPLAERVGRSPAALIAARALGRELTHTYQAFGLLLSGSEHEAAAAAELIVEPGYFTARRDALREISDER